MRDRLFIRLLTKGELQVDAPFPIEWKGRTARTLLTILAMHPGEAVSRDRLAWLLWPDNSQSSARGNLRMALLALRRALSPAGQILDATNEAVTLLVGKEDTDIGLLETLAARDDPQSRERILELYRVDLLPAMPDAPDTLIEFLRSERERLREIALRAGRELLAAREADAKASDAPAEIGPVAHKLLTIDPANEPVHRAMMRAYLAAGDRAAALRQYEACRHALAEQYDLEPAPDTDALRDEALGPSGSSAGAATDAAQSPRPRRHEGHQPPAPARTAPMRRARRALVAAALVLAGAAVGAAWMAGKLLPGPGSGRPASQVRVLIEPVAVTGAGCDGEALARNVRIALEEALVKDNRLLVLLPGASGAIPSAASGDFSLKARVICSGDRVRMYVDLRDARSGDTMPNGPYEIAGHTLQQSAHEFVREIIPVLVTG